jgi:glycosyltransferase involved in cell wall biosynthesis
VRIGVDAACWANGRGYGRFTQELMRAAVARAPEDQFVFFLDPLAATRFELTAPNVARRLVKQSRPPAMAAAADGSRSVADLLRFTSAVWAEPLDVFFEPSVYTYFPLPPRLRAIVTVHDAIAERFPSLTLPTARARLFWRLKVALALAQSRLVLTVSDYAAREIGEVHGLAPSRIRVATEAPASVFRPSAAPDVAAAARRAGLPAGARWFMYVGGFSPHKRVGAIVRAHAAVAAGAGALAPHLLLVGAIEGDVFLGDQPAIRDAIARAGTSPLVHWTGFVADEELRHLHSGAIALLLPSMSEGFGLPAVEAAACGAPVIATTASPLPELLAGGGVFVAPEDEAALASAMRRLLGDEAARAAMGRCALDRARALTWERSADAALAAIREAAA